jgi:hypothetical protein
LYFYVRNSSNAVEDPSYLYRFADSRERVPPPDGYTSKGMRVGIASGKQSGWVVRYSAKGCEFSRKDDLLWNKLESKIRDMGFQVIVTVPSAKDEYPNDSEALGGALQETYVNIAWIKQFRLRVTPTLLIFDFTGRLIWSHQGMLGPNDPKSALRAIKSSRGGRM